MDEAKMDISQIPEDQKQRIRWTPTKKQLEALDLLKDKLTTELLFGGGAGGGKSFLGCAWLIYGCISYEGTRWLMGRAVLKNLKESTLLTFFDVNSQFGFKQGVDYTYKPMDGTIHYYNGSTVHLKDLFQYPSDPDFDSLGSTEYTGAFIDEGSQVTSKAKNIVASRLRYRLDENGLIPKLLIASNPSKNFLYSEFYKPSKEGTLPVYKKFIQSLVGDNPHISRHYIENLKKMDKTSQERLLYGNWEYEDDPSRLIEYDAIMDLFTNKIPPSEEKYIICDVARLGGDKITMGYWEGYMLKKIKWFTKKTTDFTTKELCKWEEEFKVMRSHIIVDEDGVGGGVKDQMPGIKGFVNNATPFRAENYANLKSQCYFYLADYINKGNIGIEGVDGQVKEWIIEELEQVKRKDADKDGKLAVISKDIVKEKIGRSPDFSDMLMMRMYFKLNDTRFGFLKDPDNVTGLF